MQGKTSVLQDALIRYDGSVSAYFGVWSIQSPATSLALKPFDGQNFIEGLMGRRFKLVSSYGEPNKTEIYQERIMR